MWGFFLPLMYFFYPPERERGALISTVPCLLLHFVYAEKRNKRSLCLTSFPLLSIFYYGEKGKGTYHARAGCAVVVTTAPGVEGRGGEGKRKREVDSGSVAAGSSRDPVLTPLLIPPSPKKTKDPPPPWVLAVALEKKGKEGGRKREKDVSPMRVELHR